VTSRSPIQSPRRCFTRAARGNLADFDRILANVPDVPPMPGDELPPGYVSPLPRQ
jgi:hypothetical protein